MEKYCRGCLVRYEEPTELLQYTEKNRRLFVYSTGIQVKRTDTFTFQLCKDCYLNMKVACNFKKQCRNSDKRFRSYLGLKENEDSVDLCTFLKNSDDSWTFRFPGNSTPAYQRSKEDDNESTNTSIRNFMMDIMPEDDLPDTEARIIKEVIDEEADVLDDSLDSHWLQDDASIDTDFRLDFSFSPFSTPRPVNNDRYTPKKITKTKETKKTNESKQMVAVTKKLDNLDMPIIDDESNHSMERLELEREDETNRALIPIKVDRNFDETMDSLDVVNEFLNYESNNTEDIDATEFTMEGDLPVSLESVIDNNEVESKTQCAVEKNLEACLEAIDNNEVIATQCDIKRNIESSLKRIDNNEADPARKCTIDKNLEWALNNTDNKEFSLDQLLVSPRVIPGIQSPPTPLINNILFGDKLDIGEDSNSSDKYTPGQCIEAFENVTGDVEMTEEFAVDMKIDEIDIDELKTEMINEIDRHANEDIKQSRYVCKYCHKEFKHLKRFERHSKNHKVLEEVIEVIDGNVQEKQQKNKYDVTNFYCNMCKKKFKTLKTLQDHAIRHQKKNMPPRKLICDHCGRVCNDKTNFLRHLQTHLRPPRPKYECDICKMEFTSANAHKQHKRSHMGDAPIFKQPKKRFVCTECGATMDKASNFRIHIKRHKKEYTHVCSECNKGFFRKAELTIHMRYHTGEKPFQCTRCDKKFVRRDGLTTHMKHHLDLKPYQCDYCKSRYVNSTNLKNHYKYSASCQKARDKMAADQKKLDENGPAQSFVTEEIVEGQSKNDVEPTSS